MIMCFPIFVRSTQEHDGAAVLADMPSLPAVAPDVLKEQRRRIEASAAAQQARLNEASKKLLDRPKTHTIVDHGALINDREVSS